MGTMLITSKVKADKVDENTELIRKVFEQLKEQSPSGVHYAVFKDPDSNKFVHLVSAEKDNTELAQLPAFIAYRENAEQRFEEPPTSTTLEVIGSYRFPVED